MINIDELKPKIHTLAEKYGLSLVLLFGSQATGKTHKESDVDIAFIADQKLDFMDQAKLNTELSEMFRNERVDIVNMKTASPLLLKHTVKAAHILYERTPHVFDSMYAYALKIYEESKPLFDLRRHYLDYKISQYRHA